MDFHVACNEVSFCLAALMQITDIMLLMNLKDKGSLSVMDIRANLSLTSCNSTHIVLVFWDKAFL